MRLVVIRAIIGACFFVGTQHAPQEDSIYPSYELKVTMNCEASSEWSNSKKKYSAEKAIQKGRYWCSERNGGAPQFWWISFKEKPVEIVSIAFEEKYQSGAEFEFFASASNECDKNGKPLINGTRNEIKDKKFENGQAFQCYGLKITNLPNVGKYGPLATLKNFRFLFQVKQDCYKPKHDRNGERYRGNRNVTYSGKTCQHWSSQRPWNHTFQPDSKKYKKYDLSANYCRNPDGSKGGPWCFTADDQRRQENCFKICVECDPHWKAQDGKSCQDYAKAEYCQADGDHYGPGWDKTAMGTFWSDGDGRSALNCTECGCGKVRLVDDFGINTNEGRLEFYHNGEWHVFCADKAKWRAQPEQRLAKVACGMMGKTRDNIMTYYEWYGRDEENPKDYEIYQRETMKPFSFYICEGHEKTITDCNRVYTPRNGECFSWVKTVVAIKCVPETK